MEVTTPKHPHDYDVPDLSDEEIIELFADYEPMPENVCVVPPPVQAVSKGGIRLPQQVIDQQKNRMWEDGVLVVSVGSEVTHCKVGDWVHLASHTNQLHISEARGGGYVLSILQGRMVVARIKK